MTTLSLESCFVYFCILQQMNFILCILLYFDQKWFWNSISSFLHELRTCIDKFMYVHLISLDPLKNLLNNDCYNFSPNIQFSFYFSNKKKTTEHYIHFFICVDFNGHNIWLAIYVLSSKNGIITIISSPAIQRDGQQKKN